MMKATSIGVGVLMLCASAVTHAQPSYSEIVDQQRFCEQTGELWREVHETDTIMGKPLKQWSADQRAGKYTSDQFQHMLMIFISAGAKKAEFRNGQDAYMAGWAQCMDDTKHRKERNARRAAREAREAAAAASGPAQSAKPLP